MNLIFQKINICLLGDKHAMVLRYKHESSISSISSHLIALKSTDSFHAQKKAINLVVRTHILKLHYKKAKKPGESNQPRVEESVKTRGM